MKLIRALVFLIEAGILLGLFISIPVGISIAILQTIFG
jgi:hypothetical protein